MLSVTTKSWEKVQEQVLEIVHNSYFHFSCFHFCECLLFSKVITFNIYLCPIWQSQCQKSSSKEMKEWNTNTCFPEWFPIWNCCLACDIMQEQMIYNTWNYFDNGILLNLYSSYHVAEYRFNLPSLDIPSCCSIIPPPSIAFFSLSFSS